MKPSGREQVLENLREQVSRLERTASGSRANRTVLAFGLAPLDRRLPGGGLPLGCLHEVEPGGRGLEHGAAAILFTAGILARLKGPVLWCLRSRDLFAPALARAGLHPDRVIYAETWRDAEILPAMEEGVRCPGLAGVVGEIGRLSLTASRRLQLAAEATGVMALVLRRWRGEQSVSGAGEGSAAATRWRVRAMPHSSDHAGSRPATLAGGAAALPRRAGRSGPVPVGAGGLR
jgi:protein ImuA